jgi:predicted transcriptional regulator
MEMSEHLKLFFKERPAVKLSGFAKECGCTRAHLYTLIDGTSGVSRKLTTKILFTMDKYGYKL